FHADAAREVGALDEPQLRVVEGQQAPAEQVDVEVHLRTRERRFFVDRQQGAADSNAALGNEPKRTCLGQDAPPSSQRPSTMRQHLDRRPATTTPRVCYAPAAEEGPSS